MSAELSPDLPLEIAHLLLIDVVGYSKLLVNDQVESLQQLNHIVRSTDCFRAAEAKDKLIRLPTGDGMALLFFESLEQPAHCALEIAQALQNHPEIQVRMGIHSGPINQVPDVRSRSASQSFCAIARSAVKHLATSPAQFPTKASLSFRSKISATISKTPTSPTVFRTRS